MSIYRTLKAIYYMLLKLVLEKDWPDGQWQDITKTVQQALDELYEKETEANRIEESSKQAWEEVKRLRQRENYLEDQCTKLTQEVNKLEQGLNKRTKGKLVKMHLQLTEDGHIQHNKIPAIKELRNITEIGLADAKNATEAAYDRPYIEIPIYEGDYRRLKDGLCYWKRIPKKKKKA